MIAIIRHPRAGTIVFDTGYGEALYTAESAAAYRRFLPFVLPEGERLGVRVQRVDLVFLSHFHPDHIGGLREVPGAPPILHSRAGLAKLRSLKGWASRRSAFFPELLPDDFEARAQAFEDFPAVDVEGWGQGYDVAGDGSLVAIALPGHAAGQFGLMCRFPDGQRTLLCADAAWLRVNLEQRRPAWPVRLLVDDYKAFEATLDRLAAFARAYPSVRIVPSHCEESIGAL